MPTTTTDQGITIPVDADSADNPVAFTNNVAGIEQRLVRQYTNEADRTARMLVLPENAMSGLATENRLDVWDGAAHVSLYHRSVFANLYRTADSAALVSNTTLQNDTDLAIALPTAGRFQFEAVIFYDSSTTADFKAAFTVPAGATLRWGGIGASTTVSGGVGPGQFSVAIASGAAIVYGGSGTGTANTLILKISGTVVMGGTSGPLWFQWAQNTSDATNTIVRANSRLTAWRVA